MADASTIETPPVIKVLKPGIPAGVGTFQGGKLDSDALAAQGFDVAVEAQDDEAYRLLGFGITKGPIEGEPGHSPLTDREIKVQGYSLAELRRILKADPTSLSDGDREILDICAKIRQRTEQASKQRDKPDVSMVSLTVELQGLLEDRMPESP